MEVLDTGGKRRQRIVDYFVSLDNLLSRLDKNGQVTVFQYYGCQVEVCEEVIRQLGVMEMPRVKVIFDGDPEVQQQMVDMFRLHFLSAGG